MPRHRPRPSSQIRARYSTNQKKKDSTNRLRSSRIMTYNFSGIFRGV